MLCRAVQPEPVMYRSIHAKTIAAKPRPTDLAVTLYTKSKKLPSQYRVLDRSVGGALSRLIRCDEFRAEKGDLTTLYPPKGASRLFVLGMGERATFTLEALRVASARLVNAASKAKLRRVDLRPLVDGLGTREMGCAIGEGLMLGNFSFDTFKGTTSNQVSSPARPRLSVHIEDDLRAGVARGLLIGESVNVARQLAATPPNIANPTYLVSYCRKMARQIGLDCSIVDAKKARAMGMNGLVSVGAAGSAPPAMICLRHRPARPRAGPILIVGKAITFDTGGYSLKPRDSMTGMKYDKCGGMAVIGAMRAIAQCRLPIEVVGLIPTAENMISDRAYRVDDILTLFNGVTVEVTNTDAEGRLVLADALAYGCKRYKPIAVIDLATLTGGIVVALGNWCAGSFCNDDSFHDVLHRAGEHCGERIWRLPLWNEHKQYLKATHADIVNASGRMGHPIQGAAFLAHFVGPGGKPDPSCSIPWAHLDIAGVASVESGSPLYPKGPTGWGVRLLLRTIETWKIE